MLMASATFANHMNLVSAVEKVIKHEIPIVNCPKCLTFWLTLAYSLLHGVPVITSVAISFIAAYMAIWFNLLLGVIDTIYNEIYENTFTTEAADTEDTETEVS